MSDAVIRTEAYTSNYYSKRVERSVQSAKVVLELLYHQYRPVSVIDVGCGRGSWLAAAESYGSTILRGLDGHWVKLEQLLSPQIEFTPIDFEKDLNADSGEKHDLCISVEVAEHLSESKAGPFVKFLCSTSDVVLFSAAIKYQGGTNHINEQWQSFWIRLFDANHYQCFDMFRKAIWGNEDVEWWYRQNLFLFVRRSSAAMSQISVEDQPIADVVHPGNYMRKVRQLESFEQRIQQPTLRFCLGCIKRYVFGWMKFRGAGANLGQELARTTGHEK